MEYEVALYREATQRSEDGLTVDIQDEIPVDQAVPIGTKLQLRATINDKSGNKTIWFSWFSKNMQIWKFCYVICKFRFSLEIRQIARGNHFDQSQKRLLSRSHHPGQGRVSIAKDHLSEIWENGT